MRNPLRWLHAWRRRRLEQSLAHNPYWQAPHVQDVPANLGYARLHLEHFERVRTARLRQALFGHPAGAE